MNSESYAPIALFAYNRADKLNRCLRSLEKCKGTESSLLYIFSDGAKNEKDAGRVKQVRTFIEKYVVDAPFLEIKVIFREKNMGLANSLIAGISEIFKNNDRIIVVEDDLTVREDFLTYMNGALAFYDKYLEYGSISAYTDPLPRLESYSKDIYVTERGDCWGWGTWKRCWETVDWNMDHIWHYYTTHCFFRLHFRSLQYDLGSLLRYQKKGKIDSWAVRWDYHLLRSHLLTVYPAFSLVKNLGVDGSGTHTFGKIDIQTNKFIPKWHFQFERLGIDRKLQKEAAVAWKPKAGNKIRSLVSRRNG